MCLMAWPRNSSGSSGLGSGFFGAVFSVSFPLSAAGLSGPLAVGQGDRGQAEVALEAGLELAEAARTAGQVPGEFPGERARCRPGELGIIRAGFLLERIDAQQRFWLGQAIAHLRGQDRADHLADGQRRRLLLAAGSRRVPDQKGVLLLPVADEAGIEDDVAVDHLAGERVGPQARHRVAAVVGDPAERAVVGVFGVEVVAPGFFPANGDGILEADLLERLVPLANPFLDVGPVFDRHGVFDVPDDLLAGRRELGGGIRLLEPPAIDHADEVRVGVGDAEIFGCAQEVADAVVGGAGAVAEIGSLHQAVVDDQR